MFYITGPDGIVCVVKYTSARKPDCRKTEADYERLARTNSDTVFLRSYAEYENAEILFAQAKVTSLPTFDVFYSGMLNFISRSLQLEINFNVSFMLSRT